MPDKFKMDVKPKFQFPNFIRTEGGHTIPVSDLSKEGMEAYIELWAQGFRQHVAQKKQSKEAETND